MFIHRTISIALFAAAMTLAAGTLVAATPDVKYSTIRVKDMHCATCAKKIAAKLYVLPGVLEVRADVEKNLAFVVPQKSKSVSPRAMWEAIESAGFVPVSLDGPAGTFTAKPND